MEKSRNFISYFVWEPWIWNSHAVWTWSSRRTASSHVFQAYSVTFFNGIIPNCKNSDRICVSLHLTFAGSLRRCLNTKPAAWCSNSFLETHQTLMHEKAWSVIPFNRTHYYKSYLIRCTASCPVNELLLSTSTTRLEWSNDELILVMQYIRSC